MFNRLHTLSRWLRRPVGKGILLVAALVLSSFGGAWLESRSDSFGSVTSQKKIVTSQSQLISRIARQVGPGVVSVNVAIARGPAGDYGTFDLAQPGQQAAGTGIIISKEGLIVTNRHVVAANATDISVTLSDGTELENVSVVGRTNDNDSLDIAFLKIKDRKGHQLSPVEIGNSSKVQVGDNVVAIGNALGQFQNTVTSGIISGYGRSVQARDRSGSAASAENLDNLFQTDAAINEGNSGGPLVNLDGQVIGINTAVAADSQNIGFAIPINDVRGLIDQVLKNGKFERPFLGVRYVPLTADIAAQFKLKTDKGAFIIPSEGAPTSSVLPDSPAAKAGLKERDVITEVNGERVDATHSLVSQLSPHRPGDKVKLTVLRDNKTIRLEVTLGKTPAN